MSVKRSLAATIRATVPVVVLSLCVFVGIATLSPTRAHGQPQGKDKTKAKAKQTAVRTVTIASGLWHPGVSRGCRMATCW